MLLQNAPIGPMDAAQWLIEQAGVSLPSEPVLIGGAVGVAGALAGGNYAARQAMHRVARAAASWDGYALPMNVWDHRRVGQLERHGNCLSIPRTGSILALGATRSGKTETGKHVVAQMRADDNEPMIIYDHKEDYQQFLSSHDQECIRISASDSTAVWNIFREIETEADADEVARAIFADTDESEYFDVAGRQVFAAVLKLISGVVIEDDENEDDENEDDENEDEQNEHPTNADLVRYFKRMGRSDVYENLLAEENLSGAASHLDPESSKQASGVYAAVQRQINDTFLGDFAAEPDGRKEFSIREYMHDPQGKALVLDYPYREGESTTPLFRLLIDLAAREALDDGERGAYFVLDEVAQIPHLDRLDELVNVGAGRAIQVFITLQSVAQLRANYGKENASAILSGLTSAMLLRSGDPASTDFIRFAIGEEFEEYTAHVEKANLPRNRQKTMRREMEEREKPVFSKHEISNWTPGEGVLVRPNSWAYGRVKQKK